MLGAYASLALICAASLVVGQAIFLLCGRRELTWLSGPVGLAAVLAASGIAIKLPGHAAAVAIALAVLVAIAVALVARSGLAGPVNVLAPAAGALAVLITSVPFVVNGKVGILGVGLVNDDMASHLLIADWLGSRVGETPILVHQGYPVGPHSLVAGLDSGLGVGLVEGFAGLTLAIPALVALIAFEALDGFGRAQRVVVSALVAVPYLAAAYLAQEAFKEPIESFFLLSFALLLPAAKTARGAIPLGVIAAGAVYTYSFPGLFWLAGGAAIYLVVAWWNAERPGIVAMRGTSGRSAMGAALIAAVAVLLLLTAPEWGRIEQFTHFRAFHSSTLSEGLGNLRHHLSPFEALGIWPASDFRLSASDASVPAPAFYLGALIALAALAVGLPRWLRRHGPAVPAALASALVIYLGARLFGTVYTSAKALAISSPLITLVALGGLLAGWEGIAGPRLADPNDRRKRRGEARWPLATSALAAAMAAGIALSSFLVLRAAPVAPQNHAEQLAELRPHVQGRGVLFLGRDNFVAYELRGARPFTAVRNFYDPHFVNPNQRLGADVYRKFDFDSVTPRTLDGFPYVITTRAEYASGPPPGFEPLRTTDDYVLWQRTAPVGDRRTLAEGDRPGAVLDCSHRGARRISRSGGPGAVLPGKPVIGGGWSPSATVESGSPVTQTLTLPAGRWRLSIQYDATRRLHVSAPGLEASLPANLDYRGSAPFFDVGTIDVPRAAPMLFTASVERPPLAGRLLGAKSTAHLGTLAATRATQASGAPLPGGADRTVGLDRACGRYLDWYRPPASG